MRGGRWYWVGLAAAVVLLGTGAAVAIRGFADQDGPAGAVRGYFTALQDGDASTALSYGSIPSGPRHLLTDAALAVQNANAGIKRVQVAGTTRHGTRADVDVRYVLDFPGDPQQVDTEVAVHEVDDAWRLDAVAVPTVLSVSQAGRRATILGTRVTSATVLLFPGAVPVRFDTAYLELHPSDGSVAFDAPPTTDVGVQVSAAGRTRARELVESGLLACLTGHGPRTCPQPGERYLPGSLRGALQSADSAEQVLQVDVGDSADGVLEVSGDVAVVGTYRRLTFANQVRTGKGTVQVPVLARSYASAPLRFVWAQPGDDS